MWCVKGKAGDSWPYKVTGAKGKHKAKMETTGGGGASSVQ